MPFGNAEFPPLPAVLALRRNLLQTAGPSLSGPRQECAHDLGDHIGLRVARIALCCFDVALVQLQLNRWCWNGAASGNPHPEDRPSFSDG